MDIPSPSMDSSNLDEQVENLTCPKSTVHHRPSSSTKALPVFVFPPQQLEHKSEIPTSRVQPAAALNEKKQLFFSGDIIKSNMPPMEQLNENKQLIFRSMSLDSGAAAKIASQLPSSSTQPSSKVNSSTLPGQSVSVFVNERSEKQPRLYASQLSPTSTTVSSQPAYRRMSEDTYSDHSETQGDVFLFRMLILYIR